MDTSLQEQYGNRLRVRVCGICANDTNTSLLVVNLQGISANLNVARDFWSPVGGGVEFGETLTDALKREFLEETGLEIEIQYFMCVYEYLELPIHAVELFFAVRAVGGMLQKGIDPEHQDHQLITAVTWKTWAEIQQIPFDEKHGIFKYANSIENLRKLKGYFRA